jgi:hypothetical protein
MANILADKVVAIALKQLQVSYNFKRPRIERIKDFRRLYNTQVLPKLRIQFNVPLPVFSGMVDTLNADLNDKLVIEYKNTDPADWKAVEKANAALQKEMESARPGAQWSKKFRQYRFEKIITGRGIMKLNADNDKGFNTDLEVVPFEDFFFEPTGGGTLENHFFSGQQNIWKSKYAIQELADAGIYDKGQVAKLLNSGGKEYKTSGLWDSNLDIVNRFAPLGLSPENNNYVGDEMFNLCEWVTEYQGKRWYLVFEPLTGIWLRFEKNSDISSADYFPWISSASHEDIKNFASKSFADDLYPVADSIITLFNQDLTNRQKRNLNARAYDKEMFKDLAKLDEAQYRPDALVPVDTKNGSRRIAEGIYAFETPEISGTINTIDWLQITVGKNLGVTEMQQGAVQSAQKKVGVVYTEMAQVSKRLEFCSAPFIEAGQQLGEHFFVALKDYMKEPMAIKLIGEKGFEWDVLKRIDLNIKRDFEISVTSSTSNNNMADVDRAKKEKAIGMLVGSPNINPKTRDKFILSDIGGFSDYETNALMDVSNETDKETMSEVAAAIQLILMESKKPATNYNADVFFINTLFDFAKNHRDTLTDKQYKLLLEYFDEEKAIVEGQVDQLAKEAAANQAPMPGGVMPNGQSMPGGQPMPAVAEAMPQPQPTFNQ